jgi:hypothetical protein
MRGFDYLSYGWIIWNTESVIKSSTYNSKTRCYTVCDRHRSNRSSKSIMTSTVCKSLPEKHEKDDSSLDLIWKNLTSDEHWTMRKILSIHTGFFIENQFWVVLGLTCVLKPGYPTGIEMGTRVADANSDTRVPISSNI